MVWRWVPMVGLMLVAGCGKAEVAVEPSAAKSAAPSDIGKQVKFTDTQDIYDSIESFRAKEQWFKAHAHIDDMDPAYLAVVKHRLGTVLLNQDVVIQAREPDAVKIRALHVDDVEPPNCEGWVRPW